MLYCSSLASSLVKAEVNWGLWSDTTFLCSPNHLKTWLKKSWAIPVVSTVLVQGARITPLLRPEVLSPFFEAVDYSK